MRCPEPCGKTRFDSHWKARLSGIRAAMTEGIILIPYHADDCGCYHLSGHSRGRLRRGKDVRRMKQYTPFGGR